MVRSTRVLDEQVFALDPPLELTDWDAVRKAFSGLMDRAAESIFRWGLDQDDCIVDRVSWLRHQQEQSPIEVVIEGLASVDSLWIPYCRSAVVSQADMGARASLQLTAIGFRIGMEQGVPFRRELPESLERGSLNL